LIDRLRKELGFAVDVTGGQAGMHLCVSVSKKTNDLDTSERAARQKLRLAPLSPCHLGKPSRQGFILGFWKHWVEEIPNAVRKLRNLILASSG
jgi:GntR family transcriptional regulator / MocR family aminotransferase